MDPLAHLSVGLILSELLGLEPIAYMSLALGSIFPDVDGIGNFIGIPLHRSILHDPLLWLTLIIVNKRALKKQWLAWFSLGALLHCIADIPFGLVPFYPLPLLIAAKVSAAITGTKLTWMVLLKLNIGTSVRMYAHGYLISEYGDSLFLTWLIIAVLRRFKLVQFGTVQRTSTVQNKPRSLEHKVIE